MKKRFITSILFMLLTTMMLTSCISFDFSSENDEVKVDSEHIEVNNSLPNGEYNKGVILVKSDSEIKEETISQFNFASVKPLYSGSSWYVVELEEGADTVETVAHLRELGIFDKVDYDYIMSTTQEGEAQVTDNPNYKDQTNLNVSNIPYGWTQNGKAPGGSSDVVVAVIDTGVDYNHLDLRNNIWTNVGEIPGNGVDDDGNGYIDDIYGWDCVGDDNDPMDDNGHGTHVAGIVAAENNKIGGVGVAYGCKVMVLKAGNSSGYFNNSDIAEAVEYAYMNGASVINMSFGGSNISIAVEEALEEAYNSCVLVAAAGNSSACNNIVCKTCTDIIPSYPASLSYVIGVMSIDSKGKNVSSFSNYDHYPYGSVEYEVYAVGEGVCSTWPNNKYATLNGTSMSAPTVAGIAALLRSKYSDREVYSTKYIQSQIVNTGILKPYNNATESLDSYHSVVDIYQALNKLPKPEVNLYDYYYLDNVEFSSKNNGNGVIDAGETIRIYVDLHNRGGVATNVNLSISNGRDEQLNDPYIDLVSKTMSLSDIGTYSIRKSGEEKYFEINVADNCPNDYIVKININFEYKNGLDEKDDTIYVGTGNINLNIYKGEHLPNEIATDLILSNDKEYIVSSPVFINPGVTVIIEEGVTINTVGDSAINRIVVAGTLIAKGTNDYLINLHTGIELWGDDGYVEIQYADAYNYLHITKIDHCICRAKVWTNTITNSVIYDGADANMNVKLFKNCVFTDPCKRYGYAYDYRDDQTKYENCVFYTADSYESIMKVDMFVPGTTNALLNNDIKAEPYIHNVNGIVGSYSKRLYNVIYAPMYDTNLTMEENTYSTGMIYWGTSDKTKIESYIYDFYDDPEWGIINKSSFLTEAPEDVWPFVTNVYILNKDGEEVTTISKEEVTFVIEFNRDMDTSLPLSVKFGTVKPYSDYKVTGDFVSSRCWVGKYTLKSNIENGLQYLNVSNGRAVDDHFMTLYEIEARFGFNIDTSIAFAMNLQATPKESGIELRWFQDDYETLLGYNIYRSDSKDGNYVKINNTILLPTDEVFLDQNAEPGKTYWYTYTVVLSDFSESKPAGKVTSTAQDTINPNIYHVPVNQGYTNNNLVISCTASDNVAISKVTLYYRTIGDIEWKKITMSKQSDKYSAIIFGSELTLDGIEYYIVAEDNFNAISKGSDEEPYLVIIKDSSAISRIGDVDGDGVVTTKDALMLMKCINGELILTDDEFKRADLNKDGVLNSSEALRILQYINGKINTLEM